MRPLTEVRAELNRIDRSKYNGKEPQQIADNLPDNMPKAHREIYMKGVDRVISCQRSGYNLNEIEAIKNHNHELHKLYHN